MPPLMMGVSVAIRKAITDIRRCYSRGKHPQENVFVLLRGAFVHGCKKKIVLR